MRSRIISPSASHGVARGPMAEIANDLHAVSKEDIRAMAVYLTDQAGPGKPPAGEVARQQAAQNERRTAAVANSADSQAAVTRATDAEEGASIYVSACAGCHEGPRAMPFGGIDLALSSGIAGPSPTNLFNVVLYGLPATGTGSTPIMPGFAAAMNDAQLVALAHYLRAHFTDKEPWSDIEKSLREARSAAREASTRPAPRQRSAPGATSEAQNEAQR